MAFTIEQVTTSVKLRKGIADASKDTLIADLADEMMQKALDYCRIDTLPDGLKPTIVAMTCDRLSEYMEQAGTGTGIVTSVSDGQQSVSYKSASEALKKSDTDTDILHGYAQQLNRYRTVKFQ